jgi:hypothetical protein
MNSERAAFGARVRDAAAYRRRKAASAAREGRSLRGLRADARRPREGRNSQAPAAPVRERILDAIARGGER